MNTALLLVDVQRNMLEGDGAVPAAPLWWWPGMQSEYCVRATARAARAAGFDVVLAAGAHAAYDDGTAAAAEISGQVEQGLVPDGVEVRDAAQVEDSAWTGLG